MAIRNRRTRSPCICSCSYPGSPWSILSFHTLFCLFQVLFSTAARKKQKQKRKTKTKNKQKEKRNEKTHVNNRQKSISHVAYPPPQFLYLCVFVFWFSLTVINVTVVIMMRSFVSGLIRFSFKYRARICWEAVH